MFRIGLSSSAFLASTPEEVLERAKSLGFEGVEWAGSPHLGAGDAEAARKVMLATLRSGLTVVSYAPLFRVVPGGGRGISFEAILGTAREIYAPIIRIYAGGASPRESGEKAAYVDELRRLGELACQHGITLALSPDPRSVTPGLREAVALVSAVDHPFVRLVWEPAPSDPPGFGLASLEETPELYAIVRPRAVDRDGTAAGLDSEPHQWTSIIAAFSSKPGPRDIGRFILLGGIGDCRDETLGADIAFARRALTIPEAMERG